MGDQGGLVGGVDFVALSTHDIEQAGRFYGNALMLHHRHAPRQAEG